MPEEQFKSIQRRILELQTEHRDLDEVVASLSLNAEVDQLLLRRMKKRKLQLKDQIARLKSELIPDLDA
ncbi:MAG: YdcH family protein [Gammaproteobacteria bacterium]